MEGFAGAARMHEAAGSMTQDVIVQEVEVKWVSDENDSDSHSRSKSERAAKGSMDLP